MSNLVGLNDINCKIIEQRDDQGRLLNRTWCRVRGGNAAHRRDGPAIEEFDPATGKLIGMKWIDRTREREGGEHREGNKPAVTQIDPHTDVVVREEYYLRKRLHRTDAGPTRILRNPSNGKTILEEFHAKGWLHRDFDLPAVMQFGEYSGLVTRLEYYHRGHLHRDHGPAVIEFDEDANVTLEEYFQQGKKISAIQPTQFSLLCGTYTINSS